MGVRRPRYLDIHCALPRAYPSTERTVSPWQALGLPGYDPLGQEGTNANLLIPNEAIDPISGSVPHRPQRCRVRKAGVPAETAESGA